MTLERLRSGFHRISTMSDFRPQRIECIVQEVFGRIRVLINQGKDLSGPSGAIKSDGKAIAKQLRFPFFGTSYWAALLRRTAKEANIDHCEPDKIGIDAEGATGRVTYLSLVT